MAKFSTGLRTQMLSGGALKGALDGGLINIYSGTPPLQADDALSSVATNTLLCTISLASAGTGISFDTAASAGVLNKAPAQTWSGVNAATNTATFFRHVASGDTGASSTSAYRIQGTIATAGADLNLSSVSLTSGATQTVDYYSVALPTL
jgi:hypothetical protein